MQHTSKREPQRPKYAAFANKRESRKYKNCRQVAAPVSQICYMNKHVGVSVSQVCKMYRQIGGPVSQICNMPKQTEAQPSQILYICKQLGVPTFDPEVFISTATSTAQGSNPKAGYSASAIFQKCQGGWAGGWAGPWAGGCAGLCGHFGLRPAFGSSGAHVWGRSALGEWSGPNGWLSWVAAWLPSWLGRPAGGLPGCLAGWPLLLIRSVLIHSLPRRRSEGINRI